MFLIVSLLLASFSSHAIETQPALPLRMSIEKDVDAEFGQKLGEIAQTALNFVRAFPPDGYENNLFYWSQDRENLHGKTFHLYLATSKNSTFAPLLKDSTADALTIAPLNKSKREMPILVVMFVDRIFFDEHNREYRNGFSRFAVALAHEIYGNVQHYLELRMDDARPQTIADRVFQERKSFRASLMFLGGLKDRHEFLSLPSSIQEGILSLIPNELKAYRFWQRANPHVGLDPTCEAMVRSLKGGS